MNISRALPVCRKGFAALRARRFAGGGGVPRLALALAGVLAWAGPAVAQNTGNTAKGGAVVKPMARLLEHGRQKLDVKDDQEWKIIQDRLERVLRAQREYQNGLFSLKARNLPNGGKKADKSGLAIDSGSGVRGGSGSEVDAAALRRIVDSKAEANEVKSAVAKVRATLKQQQEELERAQEDLRVVLTPRQEAVALLSGWLR